MHITNWQVPGYGYEEINLAKAQVRLGHRVDILASNFLHPKGAYSVFQARFPERRVDPRIETVEGVTIHRFRTTEVLQRAWLHGLERHLIRSQPDVIHCHNLLQFHTLRVAMLSWRRRWSGQFIIDDHMHRGFQRRDTVANIIYWLVRTTLTPFIATQAHAFCAIADDTREYLRVACGVQSAIHVMPLGVDTHIFRSDSAARIAARSQIQSDPETVVYLYIGKVIRPKMVHELVLAAMRLSACGLPSNVVIAGDTDRKYQAEMEAAVSENGQRARFTFLPSRPYADLPSLYAAADVAVWPAEESMSLFEAMASGVPAIVSSESGLAHFAEKGLCATFKPGGLLEAMVAMRDPERRRLIAETAIDYAQSNLSWDRSAQRYLRLYRGCWRKL